MYYPCNENTGADQHLSYCEADLRFVFAYANRWFSHEAAHMLKAWARGCLHVNLNNVC